MQAFWLGFLMTVAAELKAEIGLDLSEANSDSTTAMLHALRMDFTQPWQKNTAKGGLRSGETMKIHALTDVQGRLV